MHPKKNYKTSPSSSEWCCLNIQETYHQLVHQNLHLWETNKFWFTESLQSFQILRIHFLWCKSHRERPFLDPKSSMFWSTGFLGYWKGWFRKSKSHGKTKKNKTNQTKPPGNSAGDISLRIVKTWPFGKVKRPLRDTMGTGLEFFTTLKTKITNVKQQKYWNITQPTLPTFSSSFIHPLHPQIAKHPPKKIWPYFNRCLRNYNG